MKNYVNKNARFPTITFAESIVVETNSHCENALLSREAQQPVLIYFPFKKDRANIRWKKYMTRKKNTYIYPIPTITLVTKQYEKNYITI